MKLNNYDIIIIGGGAAGLSAAIYSARGGMKTLLLEKLACGGQAAITYEIDNYPGMSDNPSGAELSARLEEHAKKFDVDFVKENVKSIENADGGIKTVVTRRNRYTARAIIFATGATPKKLGVPGEAELTGAGVSYCATCDGAFFKGKDVVVIGGGNTAFEDALYMSKLAAHVYILNRSDRFKATPKLVENAEAAENITIYKNAITESFEGYGKLEKVYLTKEGSRGFIAASGALIAIGISPFTDLAKSIGIETCELGFIKTDIYLKTNIPGIYAAGDCRTTPLRQVITAAADGAVAGTSAVNYIMRGQI